MTIIDMVGRIVESQGIVAGILLIMTWRISVLADRLMAKNCELTHFIMQCLSQKMKEDSPTNDSPVVPPLA